MGGDLGQKISETKTTSHLLGLEDWHQRYRQQAEWTREIRQRLFERADLQPKDRVLEVGSGTGAVLSQIQEEAPYRLTGIDLDQSSLRFSRRFLPISNLAQADGYRLPFPDACFKVVYCHYLLLWVADPVRILQEMRRVTQADGTVIALAEPDYGARIDYPPPLDLLGRQQTQALKNQGADTQIGRKLRQLFHEAGFKEVDVGILGAQWHAGEQMYDDMEWTTLRTDLANYLTDEAVKRFETVLQKAHHSGERILFIPTFYASGIH